MPSLCECQISISYRILIKGRQFFYLIFSFQEWMWKSLKKILCFVEKRFSLFKNNFQRDCLAVGPENVLWALCFPDSCTNEDVKLSVEHILTPAFQKYDITVDVAVPPSLYTSKNSMLKLTKGVLVVRWVNKTPYTHVRPLEETFEIYLSISFWIHSRSSFWVYLQMIIQISNRKYFKKYIPCNKKVVLRKYSEYYNNINI